MTRSSVRSRVESSLFSSPAPAPRRAAGPQIRVESGNETIVLVSRAGSPSYPAHPTWAGFVGKLSQSCGRVDRAPVSAARPINRGSRVHSARRVGRSRQFSLKAINGSGAIIFAGSGAICNTGESVCKR